MLEDVGMAVEIGPSHQYSVAIFFCYGTDGNRGANLHNDI